MATMIVHADDCEMSQIDASFNCTCGANPEPLEARIVACPACSGEGMWEVHTGYNPNDGSPTGYTQVCDTCDGKGEIEEEPDGRVFTDLDDPEERDAWIDDQAQQMGQFVRPRN